MDGGALIGDKWWRRATLVVQWAQFAIQVFQTIAQIVIAGTFLAVGIYIAWYVPEILDAVRMIGPGSEIVTVGARGVEAVQRGTAHLNFTDIVARSVPPDDEAAAGYLSGAGHAAQSVALLASSVAKSGLLDDLAVGVRFALDLTKHRETAMFGEASSHVAAFLSERAQDGSLKEGFDGVRALVLDVVEALRDPGTRESLDRVRRTVDAVQEDGSVRQMLDESARILRQVRENDAVAATASLEHVLSNLTEAYRQLRADLSGGIVLQMPGVGRRQPGE